MPILRRLQREEELQCSFCHKAESVVGQLVSSPSDYARAYICDECVAICSQIVEDKPDPIDGNPLLDEFLDATEQWVARERRGQDEAEQLSRMRYIAGLMFPDDSQGE